MKGERRNVCIYFRVNDYKLIRKIKERFGIKEGITVNGECYTSISSDDWKLFKEMGNRGFFDLRNKVITKIITRETIMKATKEFIDVIQSYLEGEAGKDEQFRNKWETSGKTAEQVCNYIMSEVSKSKRAGWADAEIYGMAKHFIDEDELKDPGTENGVSRVVVNKPIDLSEEDKKRAKEEAKAAYMKQLEMEEKERIAKEKEKEEKKAAAKMEKAKKAAAQEASLFCGDLFGGM